jgi:DNA-binding response OmpR family regulator
MGSMRILIVEDEHKIANAIKRGLEHNSYAVDVTYDGDSGLAAALSEDYDLIILDRMLPGSIDGIGVLKRLRENGAPTPILLLTAKDKVLDRAFGLNSGADDYLVKPFAFVELLARVRSLLRRNDPNKTNLLTYKDLSLDIEAMQVVRAGRTINLTAKEFALLEYLLRNPKKPLSKESLMKHVWDYDSDILPNTVEVYIGYLRSKIDKPFIADSLIQTKRGFGYFLGDKDAS